MGSKKPTFTCLTKAPLYQTPYSNFTTSFFNIFYYFIYTFFFSQLSKYQLFSFFFFLLSLSPCSCYSPLIFFLPSPSPLFSPGVFSPLLLVPIFFCFPIGENPLPASGENPHPSVQGGSLESENCKNKNKISIKISFSFSSFCFFY